MVKTRKNQKKQRGGWPFNLFNKPKPQPSCMNEVSNYMTNDFENDDNITSLNEKINEIKTCKVSNDTDIDRLNNYSNLISEKNENLRNKQHSEIDHAAEFNAAILKHQQYLTQKKQAEIQRIIEEKRKREQQGLAGQEQPNVLSQSMINNKQLRKEGKALYEEPPTGGNRKSKRKSRKSRKSIKKSKNNKR